MLRFQKFFIGAIGVLSASAALSQPATTFPNGDMSLGADAPEGWTIPWRASGKLELTRDMQVFKVGPASLSMRNVDGPAQGGAAHALEAYKTPFTISGFAKGSADVKDSLVAIQAFDGAGKQVGWINLLALQGGKDWQPFSQKVTLPDGAAKCQLVLTLKGEGEVWLDEIGLTVEAPPPSATDAAPLPVTVLSDDTNLLYSGRFDKSDVLGARAAWPASAVSVKFQGTDLNVKIKDGNQNRWQVEIDGQPTLALQMREGQHLYNVASGLPVGQHTARLVKATEAFCGTTQIMGFQLNEGGRTLPLDAPKRRLEVIGDSISCGYGNEASSKEEHFSPKTENAYFTYGAIAARQLGADYTCIAWSGKKMWPDNTIPEIYGRILPIDEKSQWNFATPTPDVMLINLATNDFAKSNPDKAGWMGGYKAFIARLRMHYPQAEIYCATSPMMGDWNESKAKSTLRDYLTHMISEINAAGDNKVHLTEFATQEMKDGIGADWHPSIKTHQIMADKLVATLKQDLGW